MEVSRPRLDVMEKTRLSCASRRWKIGAYIAVGIMLGLVFGEILFDSMAVGMAVGLALGAGLGGFQSR